MNLNSTKISLYVHIPYCSYKCSYCDFYSEIYDDSKISAVITETINQLNSRIQLLNKPQIDTIFIGGGTPSILPILELKRLLSAIKIVSNNPREWSIESNPESISEEFLTTCQDCGINRLSIGIQTTNNDSLKLLGRHAKFNNCENALKLVKKFWKNEFSLDFISSVPGQTKEMIKDDLDFALKYQPDHISLYALSVEDGTKLESEISKGLIEELDSECAEDIWIYGRRILNDNGYNNYEVSNYTKKSPCLHNINYWELKPYLGIGPGAVSTIVLNNQIVRVSNEKSINTFLKGEKYSWGENREILTNKDFLEDYILMGLRLRDGIDKERFYNVFGQKIEEIITNYRELINDGFVDNTTKSFKLNEKSFDIMNTILIKILDNLNYTTIKKINWGF